MLSEDSHILHGCFWIFLVKIFINQFHLKPITSQWNPRLTMLYLLNFRCRAYIAMHLPYQSILSWNSFCYIWNFTLCVLLTQAPPHLISHSKSWTINKTHQSYTFFFKISILWTWSRVDLFKLQVFSVLCVNFPSTGIKNLS